MRLRFFVPSSSKVVPPLRERIASSPSFPLLLGLTTLCWSGCSASPFPPPPSSRWPIQLEDPLQYPKAIALPPLSLLSVRLARGGHFFIFGKSGTFHFLFFSLHDRSPFSRERTKLCFSSPPATRQNWIASLFGKAVLFHDLGRSPSARVLVGAAACRSTFFSDCPAAFFSPETSLPLSLFQPRALIPLVSIRAAVFSRG